jgi:Fic/DOC family
MGDLVDYANSPAHDPVTATALVHAQFETIHPFADGNGRLGRILIGWLFRRHLELVVPPPVSVAFLRDIGGYLSGLTICRTVGPDEWVRWFAHTLERSAMSATATLAAVVELVAEWPARLGNPVGCGSAPIGGSRRYAPHLGCGDCRRSPRRQRPGGPDRARGLTEVGVCAGHICQEQVVLVGRADGGSAESCSTSSRAEDAARRAAPYSSHERHGLVIDMSARIIRRPPVGLKKTPAIASSE